MFVITVMITVSALVDPLLCMSPKSPIYHQVVSNTVGDLQPPLKYIQG